MPTKALIIVDPFCPVIPAFFPHTSVKFYLQNISQICVFPLCSTMFGICLVMFFMFLSVTDFTNFCLFYLCFYGLPLLKSSNTCLQFDFVIATFFVIFISHQDSGSWNLLEVSLFQQSSDLSVSGVPPFKKILNTFESFAVSFCHFSWVLWNTTIL